MHRWKPWWWAIATSIAVVATGCTSGSGSSSGQTATASAGPAAGSQLSGQSGSTTRPISTAAAANVFSCPSAAEINSLTAMGFVAAIGNGSDHCEYVVTSGTTEAARVTIDHPPTSTTRPQESLAQFRSAVVAAGNVVLTAAPQYSPGAFVARFGTVSCSVFALARDGEVMQVQATHRSPAKVSDCSLAQSVTAVAGTATRSGAATSDSGASGTKSGVSSPSGPPRSTPTATRTATPAPPAQTVRPAPTIPPTPTTTRRAATPSSTPLPTPSSPSEVLLFSTGPAAPITLPTPAPTPFPTRTR